MAKNPDRSAPAPSRSKADDNDDNTWQPPTSDQEFVFTSMADAPAWVDRNWASFDRGPALALPAGDALFGTGPYTTNIARVGDKVVFTAAKGAMPAKLTVIPGAGDPEAEGANTRKVPQVSNVSLEDALKTGAMTPEDLGEDAKAQVAQRTPGMRRLVEGRAKAAAPKAQSVEDIGVKTS